MVAKIYHYIKDKYYKLITLYILHKADKCKNIWLMNTPNHGNIGDQAITLAELKFLRDKFENYHIVEITAAQWEQKKEEIISKVKDEELILIHGGGYIGDLWPGAERLAQEMIDSFPRNKCIMLQNTIFYYDQKNEVELEYYNSHNVTLFLRDRISYNIAKKYLPDERIFLFPDTVLYIDAIKEHIKRRNQLLVCLRSDKEKIRNDDYIKAIINRAREKGWRVKYTDTISKHDATIGFREHMVNKKLNELRKSKLVITDRLHGMYFAAITGTPCIVVDNLSGKVFGGYEEWLSDFDHIQRSDKLDEKDSDFENFKNFKNLNPVNNLDAIFRQEECIINRFLM